jgi:hypothetical protein
VASRSANSLPPGCASEQVPINTRLPSIDGTPGDPQPGWTLTADPGGWDHATDSFDYQWQRCDNGTCTPIGGATSKTYTPTGDDVGKQLRVSVTATSPSGETDSATSSLGSLSGRVYLTSASAGNEAQGARVQACHTVTTACRSAATDAGGAYRIEDLSAGDYEVTAYPPAGSNALPETRETPSRVAGGQETTGQDLVLQEPGPPPPTVQVQGQGSRGTAPGGVPVIHWQQPTYIRYYTSGINDWIVSATISDPGGGNPKPLPPPGDPVPAPFPGCNEPDCGYFDIPVPPQFPDHGPKTVEVKKRPKPPLTNPGGDIPFHLYIDPSGFVRTTDGDPLPGAQVTLLRSDSPLGPFAIVADGSAVMSPSNRRNPDTTDSSGHFGWDVIAGYYKVQAEHDGCHRPGEPGVAFAETEVMEIPPPVTNLDIRLECASAPEADRVQGSGTIPRNTFSFDAIGSGDGTDATGTIDFTDSNKGHRISGDVVCLNVVGTSAVIVYEDNANTTPARSTPGGIIQVSDGSPDQQRNGRLSARKLRAYETGGCPAPATSGLKAITSGTIEVTDGT